MTLAFPDSQFRANAGNVGVFETGYIFLDEFPRYDCLVAALDFGIRQVLHIGGIAISDLGGMLEMSLDHSVFARYQEEADSAVAMPLAASRAFF